MNDSEQQHDTRKPGREYEKTGLYPPNGKPFRMWALFGWLTLLIVVLAGAAALLNILLLDSV